jgi:hypothetical protein
MKPLILSIADHAYIDSATGKIYILGAFNRISLLAGANFPIRHRLMTLVIKLASELLETGEHLLGVALADEDGNELLRLNQPFEMRPSQGGIPSEFNVLLEIRDIVFHKAGEFQFRIEVDNELLGDTVLVVTDNHQQG